MRALLDVIMLALQLYVWVLIASAVMSWLVAFGVVNMRNDAGDTGNVVAKLQPGVIVKLDQCNGQWCHAEVPDAEAWVSQAEIWGAYPGEAFTK